MLGKKLDLVQKTSNVFNVFNVFNIQYFNIKSIPNSAVRLMWAVWACCSVSGCCRKWKRPLFSYSRHYPVILAFMSVVLALRFCTVFNYSILFYLLCVVQSAVYKWSRPSVPGKLNFFNLLEHIIISKANDSVELKPNKKVNWHAGGVVVCTGTWNKGGLVGVMFSSKTHKRNKYV